MNCSTPGLHVHHQLPEFTQTHVHWWSPSVSIMSTHVHWWRHPTISSFVVPFSSRLPSFPASGSFPVSQLFDSGGQNIGVSASTSDLPMNIQNWSLLGWTGCRQRDSEESSSTPQFKSINSLVLSFLYIPTLTSIHDYWKNHSLKMDLCWQSNFSAF